MPTPREYRFDERYLFSQGVAKGAQLKRILLDNIPGATQVWQANSQDDRNGTDYWVQASGRNLSVDVKARERDWAATHPDEDDLALEVWSVKERRKIGWTRDPSKRTDFVLWQWEDTGRWCLVPFPMLCTVFSDFGPAWYQVYKHRDQFTRDGGYHSECLFVPRRVVWDTILARYGGNAVPRQARAVRHFKFGDGLVLATFREFLRVQFADTARWMKPGFCVEVLA